MSEEHRVIVEDKRASREDAAAALSAAIEAAGAEELKAQATTADHQAAATTPTGAAELEHWRSKAGEYLELAQRAQAEQRNYMKRVGIDIEDARRFAVDALLESLFPALDGLAQAAAQFKDTPDNQNPLLDGVRRTVKVLEAALLKHGIEKINAADVPFDPEQHQALKVEDSAAVTADTVAEVYVDGYRLGHTVLKPAMVRVLKARPSA
jgi:molecular chaperone GrpE